MLRGSMHYSPGVHRDAEPNPRLQRTWPSFSGSIVAAVTGLASGYAVLLPKAGHAAQAACYPDTSLRVASSLARPYVNGV